MVPVETQQRIYFLSITKRNMKLDTPLPFRYDKTDPVNEGVAPTRMLVIATEQ
jgi:hypothetical protein